MSASFAVSHADANASSFTDAGALAGACADTIAVPGHVALRRARVAQGMSLRQVADACGINIRQYQKFESGERDITGCAFVTALRLCRALSLDPWLFLNAAPPAGTLPRLPASASAAVLPAETADFPQRVRRLP